MPRWLFLILAIAVALSVLGSVLIVLRSPNSTPHFSGNVSTPGAQPRPGDKK
jgi:type 1 fimbria pilin